MQLTSLQRTNNISPVSWRFVWLGLALLLASWPVTALSQAPFQADPYAGPPVAEPLIGEEISGRSGQALGALFRAGFVTGPGIGREDSFAPFEFMPYGFINDGLIFGDFRGFRSVQDGWGANVGTGYRHYVRQWDRILGANFFYDYDNTSGQLFRQAGFGLETLGSAWDMRLNAYFPVTETRKELSLGDPFNLRYSGNNILFDQIRTFGSHMKGFDHELSVPLPGRILERHNVKATAGWYHFQQDNTPTAWGWKGRLEGDVISNVHMGLEVTNDKVFDTNVVLSVAVSYGGFREADGQRRTQFSRMTDPVIRQYTAVVARDPQLEGGLVATKADGTPIFVEHVASDDPYDRSNLALMRNFQPTYDPTAPLGTYENPFLTIGNAQDPSTETADIVFVWTNSVFNNTPITTESGVRLLGEADNAPHLVNIQGVDVLLPRAVDNPNPNPADPFDTNDYDLKPLLTYTDRTTIVDAVTLTSQLIVPDSSPIRTEFSGFRIGDELDSTTGATGNGIFAGPNITGVDVNYVEVNHAGVGTTGNGDGVLLQEVGEISFIGTRIFNSANNGLHVIGGTPQVTFGRDPLTPLTYNLAPELAGEIQHDGSSAARGAAVMIEQTNAGSVVNLAPNTNEQFFARINYVGATGIDISSALGNARFGTMTITDSPDQAIRILDSSGRYLFLESQSVATDILIQNPNGDAIDIQGLAAGGEVSFFGNVDIRDRQQRGVALGTRTDINGNPTGGNSGNVSFNGGLFIATDDSLADDLQPLANAIEYQFSSGDVTITNIISPANSLIIDGGRGNGIQIGRDEELVGNGNAAENLAREQVADSGYNNTGNFTLSGGAQINSVQGISLNLVRDNSTFNYTGATSSTTQALVINDRGNTGINIDRMKAPVSFADNTRNIQVIVNQSVDVNDNPAVNIQGTQYLYIDQVPPVLSFDETNGAVSFDSLTINDATAPTDAGIAGVRIADMQAPVAFGALNVTTDNGVALDIDQTGNPFGINLVDAQNRTPNGLVRVLSGTIDATDGSAIIATNSSINLNFNSVSSSNALGSGIFLADNALSSVRSSQFTLSVGDGTELAPGDSGEIINANGVGVRLINTGSIFLGGLSIRSNDSRGIFAQNLEETFLVNGQLVRGGSRRLTNADTVITDPLFLEGLVIANTEVLNNGLEGLVATDVPNVTILESQFETNGGIGVITIDDVDYQAPSEIVLFATREMPNRTGTPTSLGFADYNFTLQDVYVRENGDTDAVVIATTGGPLTPLSPRVRGEPLLNLNLIGTDFNNANGAEIFLQSLANPVFSNSALHVEWNGPMSISSQGYIYRTERINSSGVRIEQINRNETSVLDFSGNAIVMGVNGTGTQGSNSTGLELIIDGQAGTGLVDDFVVNDNFIFLNESAVGSFGMEMTFNSQAFLVLNGFVDNQNPSGLITTDPNNDFGDDFIEYENGLPNSGSLQTVNGPFGNIIVLGSDFSTGVQLTFNQAAQARIENNVIATEAGDLETGNQGFVINFNSTLSLQGTANNGVLLDGGGFQNVIGSGDPWIIFNGNLSNVDGTIVIDGTAVPTN